ncbi:MAG TPA: adenylate/guanylate cyclase domain-containing protein [Thermoanaerobaculia bacterium]|nr:adenylate/guanylate cyclase domain-containing protein [Thermoanaerobaculia bacterium]
MQCPSCRKENPAGWKFCGQCGKPLPLGCPRCGAALPAGFRYCGHCGLELDSTATPADRRLFDSTTGTISASVPTELLRPVTVLFCDLVGSVALADRLDPEELRDVVQAYQKACAEVVEKYGGHVAQLLGDGLMAYFGFPVALEHDPQRAVLAGLDLVPAVAALGQRMEAGRDLALQVRVGIHSGTGVATQVGSGETRENLVVGQVSNIASRLQSIAEPGAVVISGRTYALVQGLFECEALGPQSLKGVGKPVEVFRVLHRGDAKTLFEVEMRRGLAPLVGRADAAEALERCLERAQEGRGQVAAVVGDAGIGKSRLVQHLRERSAAPEGKGARWLDSRCSPFQLNSALAPMADLLSGLFGIKNEDTVDQNLGRLERGLRPYGLTGDELPLIASMLGLPISERFPPLDLSPQRQKERTLEALVAFVLAMAEEGAVVFFVEDLHWLDPSTLDLLAMLVGQAPTTRLLILLTLRPGTPLPWAGRGYVTQITLDRLSDEEAERLILARTGGRPLPPEVLRQLIAKTDGVPLFVEELTKMVLESGLLREAGDRFELVGPLPPLAIPATLQDSLMARVDRLAAVREVVQLAAAIGREFTFDMMRAVSSQKDRDLRRGLDQLVEAEILYQRGVRPFVAYSFRHALIQDAAYGSLLKSTRQQYHLRIARTIEERFPDLAEGRPELLAQHYSEAGLADRAISYWLSAGRRAVEHSANLEAIGHVERALALVETLREGAARDRMELELRTVLGPALIASRGYAAPEVEASYARAEELCAQVGEAPQLFWVLRGLWAYHLLRCSFTTALEFAQRMTEIARGRRDRALQFEAYFCAGMPQFFLGEFAAAAAELEAALALDSPARDRTATYITGLDVAVTTLAFSAVTLWHLGDPDRARERIGSAIRLARDIAHPFSLSDALSSAGWVHQMLREPKEVRALAEELLALSTEKGFASVALAEVQLGWALVQLDPERAEEGLGRMQSGIAAYRASGARLSETYFLSLFVEALAQLGRRDEAARALAEVRTLAEDLGPRFYWRAQLLWLEGELIAASGGAPDEAHSRYAAALEVARSQGAVGLELRAALAAARSLRATGDEAAARRLLQSVVTAFPEGSATVELAEARDLLAQLGPAVHPSIAT